MDSYESPVALLFGGFFFIGVVFFTYVFIAAPRSNRPRLRKKSRHNASLSISCESILRHFCHSVHLCASSSRGPEQNASGLDNAARWVSNKAGLLTQMPVCLLGNATSSNECMETSKAGELAATCNASVGLVGRPALSVRAALLLPFSGARKCAVVGSSASLLNASFGEEIDAHDVVIRYNSAPIDGFQQSVGAKTTVRVVATIAALGVLNKCAITESRAVDLGARCSEGTRFTPFERLSPVGCCGNVRYVIRSANSQIAHCLINTCLASEPFFELFSPVSHYLRSGFAKHVGSGPLGLALADFVCLSGPISLYGFGTIGALASTQQYHYFERCRHDDQLDVGPAEIALRLQNLSHHFPRFTFREPGQGRYLSLPNFLPQAQMPPAQICDDGKLIICGRLSCNRSVAPLNASLGREARRAPLRNSTRSHLRKRVLRSSINPVTTARRASS